MQKRITEKGEIERLCRIYKDLPPNEFAVAEGLIVQAARLRVRLDNVTEETAYSVSLSFTLILFENGSYAPETGGWSGVKSNKLEASSTRQEGGVNSVVPWYSKQAVDFTGFNVLKFNVDFGVVGQGDVDETNTVELVVGLTSSENKATTRPSNMVAKKSVSGSTGIYELDVSEISGSYHVTGITDGGEWTSAVKVCRTTTVKVWLE